MSVKYSTVTVYPVSAAPISAINKSLVFFQIVFISSTVSPPLNIDQLLYESSYPQSNGILSDVWVNMVQLSVGGVYVENGFMLSVSLLYGVPFIISVIRNETPPKSSSPLKLVNDKSSPPIDPPPIIVLFFLSGL